MAEDSMEIDDGVAPDALPTASTSQVSNPRTQDKAIAVRSVEGWVVVVTNVNEEATEEDLIDMFGEFGDVKSVSLNLDRRSGFVKGYAFIEYPTVEEANAAIAGTNGEELLEQKLRVGFAFVRAPPSKSSANAGGSARGNRDGGRARSRSPGARARNDRADDEKS